MSYDEREAFLSKEIALGQLEEHITTIVFRVQGRGKCLGHGKRSPLRLGSRRGDLLQGRFSMVQNDRRLEKNRKMISSK